MGHDINPPKWFAELMISLASVLQATIDAPIIRGYWLALQGISQCDLQKAFALAMCPTDPSYGRLPPVGKLRELSGGQNPDQQAALAWDLVLQTIKRHGTYASVDFEDRLINAAVRSIGGWRGLGSTAEDQLDWRRREFLAAYRLSMQTPPPEELTRFLRGHGDGAVKQIGSGATAKAITENSQGNDEKLAALVKKTADQITG